MEHITQTEYGLGSSTTGAADLLRAGLRPSQKVERFLRAYLKGTAAGNGDRLPSSRAIAARIGVSEGTVRNVVQRWEREGMLEARHGSGTYVRSRQGEGHPLRIGANIQDSKGTSAVEAWFAKILGSMFASLARFGPRVTFTSLYASDEDVDAVSKNAIESRCRNLDGIVLTPSDLHAEDILAYCRRHRKPVVTLNAPSRKTTANFVTTDTYSAYLRAGRALAACGRRRLVLLIYPSADRSESMAQRVAGLVNGIGDALCREVSLRVVDCEGMGEERAAMVISQLIDKDKYLPDAVICSGDPHAFGVLDELNRRGISVPGKVSVISGSAAHARALEDKITSFHHPCEEMGRELVAMLMRMLENNLLEIPAIYLPVEIIPGGTTTKRENRLLSPDG